jgi:hypothetical protein
LLLLLNEGMYVSWAAPRHLLQCCCAVVSIMFTLCHRRTMLMISSFCFSFEFVVWMVNKCDHRQQQKKTEIESSVVFFFFPPLFVLFYRPQKVIFLYQIARIYDSRMCRLISWMTNDHNTRHVARTLATRIEIIWFFFFFSLLC